MNSSVQLGAVIDTCHFAVMGATDIEDVIVIENASFPFPWTRGNFLDSLANGYDAWVLREKNNRLAGYFLLMPAVDENHVLNITVRPDLQGQGFGRMLLDKVIERSRKDGRQSILLEVRPSNQRALAVYVHAGFTQIGVRKNYYPASVTNTTMREDAIVMRLAI